MRGIDSCTICMHYPVCECRKDIGSFYSTTSSITSILDIGIMWDKIFDLAAENCKFYNDKNK